MKPNLQIHMNPSFSFDEIDGEPGSFGLHFNQDEHQKMLITPIDFNEHGEIFMSVSQVSNDRLFARTVQYQSDMDNLNKVLPMFFDADKVIIDDTADGGLKMIYFTSLPESLTPTGSTPWMKIEDVLAGRIGGLVIIENGEYANVGVPFFKLGDVVFDDCNEYTDQIFVLLVELYSESNPDQINTRLRSEIIEKYGAEVVMQIADMMDSDFYAKVGKSFVISKSSPAYDDGNLLLDDDGEMHLIFIPKQSI